MTVKQRKYVDGFKEQALTKVFARSGDQTVRSIAADVGMNMGTLRGWMKVALREQKHPSGKAIPSAEWTPAQRLLALPVGLGIHFRRRFDQPAAGVGNDEPHALETAIFEMA